MTTEEEFKLRLDPNSCPSCQGSGWIYRRKLREELIPGDYPEATIPFECPCVEICNTEIWLARRNNDDS